MEPADTEARRNKLLQFLEGKESLPGRIATIPNWPRALLLGCGNCGKRGRSKKH
jgi:hypothetical protein